MVDKIIKFVKIALWLVPVVFLFWLFNKILFGRYFDSQVRCGQVFKISCAFATKEPEKIIGKPRKAIAIA